MGPCTLAPMGPGGHEPGQEVEAGVLKPTEVASPLVRGPKLGPRSRGRAGREAALSRQGSAGRGRGSAGRGQRAEVRGQRAGSGVRPGLVLYPRADIYQFVFLVNRGKQAMTRWKASLDPPQRRAGGEAPQHSPVEHVAQGLVPDPRVHRGAGLPGNQVGSIMEEMDVHQVEGTAGTDRKLRTRAGAAGSPGRPPATPPSSPGRCRQAARGKSSSDMWSDDMLD